MSELWKPVKGYEGLYEVSNFGRIRTVEREYTQKHYSGIDSHYNVKNKIMRQHKRGNRMFVGLTKDKIQKGYSVSRIVATAFLPNPENFPVVNHKDANPCNNNVENLEWCTQSHNIKYAYDNKTKIPPHMRKVNQYDLDGNFIRTWDSMAEAGRETGSYSNIYKVCQGLRNKAGGYKWQYM